VQRSTYQQHAHASVRRDLFQSFKIFAYARALKGLQPLRRYPKLIADRKANSFLADIESQHASVRQGQGILSHLDYKVLKKC
jgi:hypothetical protein